MSQGDRTHITKEVVIVGENPARRAYARDPNVKPLWGPSARVLCSLIGFALDETFGAVPPRLRDHQRHAFLSTRANLMNLCYGKEWSQVTADNSARKILDQVPAIVVMLGRKVARSFTKQKLNLYEPVYERGSELILIPHPSGLNRMYNEQQHRERAGAVLRKALGL